MTKSQLIDAVAARSGLTRKNGEEVVNTIFSAMANALIRGDRIEIRGFGSFKTKHYARYTGRNPKTAEPIQVAAKVFRSSRWGVSCENECLKEISPN